MLTIKVLECPYCGKRLYEESNYCCSETGHGEEIEVCADCEGEGVIRNLYYPREQICNGYAYASCFKCKGTGGRNE